ncbi:MAG: phosphatidic acid phosphatase [Coprococcus sp.]
MNKKPLIPKYALLPLILAVIINCIAYFGARLFLGNAAYHNMTLPIDQRIPFVPAFIIIYFLAYVQWAAGYIVLARDSRHMCYYILGSEIAAKCICFFCFVFYPTTMVRPDIIGSGLFDMAVSYLYQIDAANNLFPSIHCLESYFCMRGALMSKKLPVWYRGVMVITTILVFASTVLLKQHVIADMAGAVVTAELALWFSRKIHIEQWFAKINFLDNGDQLNE